MGLAPVVSGRWGSAGWCCARRERGDTCLPVAECRGWRQGCVGGGGSAGSVLRSQGSSGLDEAFALSREERGLIASNARSGPIPLPLGDLEPVPGG